MVQGRRHHNGASVHSPVCGFKISSVQGRRRRSTPPERGGTARRTDVVRGIGVVVIAINQFVAALPQLSQ